MNPNNPAEEKAPISSQASYNTEVELFRGIILNNFHVLENNRLLILHIAPHLNHL